MYSLKQVTNTVPFYQKREGASETFPSNTQEVQAQVSLQEQVLVMSFKSLQD